MAGGFGNYGKEKTMRAMFLNETWASGPSTYIALSRDIYSGVTITDEVPTSGTGYAREIVANTAANWTGPDMGDDAKITNAVSFIYDPAIATWDTIKSAYFCTTSVTNTEFFAGGDLASQQLIDQNKVAIFPDGLINFKIV